MRRPDLMLVLTVIACAGVLVSTAFQVGAEGDVFDQAKQAGVVIYKAPVEQNLSAMRVGELVMSRRNEHHR